MDRQRNIKKESTDNQQNPQCQNPRQTTPQNQNPGQGQNQNVQGENPNLPNERSRERSQSQAPPRNRSQSRSMPTQTSQNLNSSSGTQFVDFLQSFRRGMVIGNFEISGEFCMFQDSSSDEEECCP